MSEAQQELSVARFYLPPLRYYQQPLVAAPVKDLFCVSCTQVGKTFSYACRLLAHMWNYTGRHPWWWIAPTYKQSVPGQRLLYEIGTSAGIIKSGPKPPFKGTPPQPLVLINGKTCEFRTWDDPTNLMGDTIAGGVVEEAGLLPPYAQSAISSRRSDSLGPLWYIGNPGLVAGPFRRLCSKAEVLQKKGGHKSFFKWTWKDKYKCLIGHAKKEYRDFIESERDELPDYEFRRLYEAVWTEDEAAVFRNIHEITKGKPLDPFERPKDDEAMRIIGVDVGQHVDYMACVGLQYDPKLRVDFLDRYRGIGKPQAAERIKRIQDAYDAIVAVELNGPGEALKQEMDRLDIRSVGFTTTNKSKQDIILQVASDFQTKRLELCDVEPLQYEHSIFRYTRTPSGNYRYSAPEGEHDDTVMATAIARWASQRYAGKLVDFT